MSYSVETISRAAQSTSAWSGGTTTQLAIYPEASDYKERNFKWRLSSALVEAEESTFTGLPGIYRHIMIIEGEMTLIHEGHREVLLKPFMKDSFSGGWNTRSIGRARDFNLMLGQGSKGELEAIFVKKEAHIDGTAAIPDKSLAYTTQGFYCVAGSAGMLVNGADKHDLKEGDLVMVHYPAGEEAVGITFKAPEDIETVIIRAGISYT
ncbi:MAG TPA: HutD family protein [Clostridia bacterium]|nr:HutD family protein [Clostridia bacterium]